MSAVATVLRHIRQLVQAENAAPFSDGQLLQRFADQRDEAAFTALVERHGDMVRGVCRQVLGNVHDAEDAFQAVFLVLARQAGTIRRPEAVAAWLHGVACRSANDLKRKAAQRQQRESALSQTEPADPGEELTLRDLRRLLNEELQRLPAHYQAPLLLCYWEGRTQEEAARQLGWSAGTLKGRLDRPGVGR